MRAKHDPAAFDAQFQRFGSAAPKLAWGAAMEQRGLDFPLEHVEQILRRLPSAPSFDQMRVELAFIRRQMRDTATLRDFLASGARVTPPGARYYHRDADAHAAMLRTLAGVVGHVDGIAAASVDDMIRGPAGPGGKHRPIARALAAMLDRSKAPRIAKVVEISSSRSHCSQSAAGEFELGLARHASSGTVWHEIGHAIEGFNRGNLTDSARQSQSALDFLNARTAGERLVTIANGEFATKDDFFMAYTGRRYATRGTWSPEATWRNHQVTEVTSTGLERLGRSAPERTTGLKTENSWAASAVDSEHFWVTLGMLGPR